MARTRRSRQQEEAPPALTSTGEPIYLISIRPVYAYQIFRGTKRYELRRGVAGQIPEGAVMVVYASGNVRAIIGEFRVGAVVQGSAEHVFIVREGTLVSPPSTQDNLDGITRRSLITLATEDLGLAFVERPIGRTELYVADEMFLCGTGAQVTPVRSVDRRPIGTSEVGPITRRLKDHFLDVCRGRVEHRKNWLTPVWG